MRRRDFLADHIFEKSFIEDVMKSFAWTTLCGAVFAMCIFSLKTSAYFQGFAVLIVFIMLITFSIIYVAQHVVIPLDAAMSPEDPYWDEKAKELSGLPKILETLKIFLTRKGIFYLILCMGYFLYANQVAEYLAEKI